MTEDEAKTKWCPHVATAGFHYMTLMKGHEDKAEKKLPFCLGSGCMMWRDTKKDEICRRGEIVDIGEGKTAIKWETIYRDTGYCGLAGKP